MKQNQTFLHKTYSNLMSYFFLIIRVFQWITKLKFLSIMTKVKRRNENETKWYFFNGIYLNLTPYLLLLNYMKVFQSILKFKFLSFMIKVNSKQFKSNKIRYYSWGIFKSGIIFCCSKNTELFQGLF